MTGKKSGVILGYLAMLVQNLSSFILTPMLIVSFGNGDYGIYKLLLSISSYFALADLGLSNAIVRYVSEYRAKNDKLSETKFVSLVFLIDIFVTFALLAVSIVFYLFIPTIFYSTFSNNEILLLKQLFFLTMINGILNLLINLSNGIIKSYENFAMLKMLAIINSFVRIVIVMLLIINKFKISSIILTDVLLSAILLIITTYYCYKYLKIKLKFNMIDTAYIKEIISYSIIIFIDALAFHLFWNADNFIIGIFLSSSAIAIYSIGTQFSTLFFSISIIVSDVIMPGIVKQIANNASNIELTNTMIKIGRIKIILMALPVIGFIFLGKDFIAFWVGSEFIEAYRIALLALIPISIAGVCDAGLYIMWAMNKHKIKSFVSLMISGVNILLSVILVRHLGILGAAIGTAFAYIAGYLIFNPIYFHKVLHVNMFKFLKETIINLLMPITLTFVFSFLICQYSSSSLLIFFAKIVLISLVYTFFMWKYGLNYEEKLMVYFIFKNRCI